MSLAHLVRTLWRCLLGNHGYVPAYEVRLSGKKEQVRYECPDCSAQTDWMSVKEHEEFKQKHNPRWGRP
jgi:hypothetical protein